MSIVGNMAGCYSPLGKTVVIVDQEGNELTGVVTEQKQIFTATDNDVREGLTYASDDGVSTGTKVIPAYHTTEGYEGIESGSDCTIQFTDELYDFTKLQIIICPFSGSIADSVAAEKIVINEGIYAVNSNELLATVTRNSEAKAIELNIKNESEALYLLRYITYKEVV